MENVAVSVAELSHVSIVGQRARRALVRARQHCAALLSDIRTAATRAAL